MQTLQSDSEPHAQLRALYQSLLGHEDRYGLFKELLSLYPTDPSATGEAERAASVRDQLNAQLRQWVGEEFEGLSANQVLLWRSIVVEERFSLPTDSDPN